MLAHHIIILTLAVALFGGALYGVYDSGVQPTPRSLWEVVALYQARYVSPISGPITAAVVTLRATGDWLFSAQWFQPESVYQQLVDTVVEDFVDKPSLYDRHRDHSIIYGPPMSVDFVFMMQELEDDYRYWRTAYCVLSFWVLVAVILYVCAAKAGVAEMAVLTFMANMDEHDLDQDDDFSPTVEEGVEVPAVIPENGVGRYIRWLVRNARIQFNGPHHNPYNKATVATVHAFIRNLAKGKTNLRTKDLERALSAASALYFVPLKDDVLYSHIMTTCAVRERHAEMGPPPQGQ